MGQARWCILAVLLAGCVPPAVRDQITRLELRVADLEAASAVRARVGEVGGPSADAEAQVLLTSLRAAAAALDWETARGLYDELAADYPDAPATRSAERMSREMAVIGRNLQSADGVERWIQGTAPDLTTGTTALVFFETWCPHCRHELPLLPGRFEGRDLSVVLVTKESRDVTDSDVLAFLGEHRLTYPTAKDAGPLSASLGVRGVPAAAVVTDGEVVWRGHPAQLTDELMEHLAPRNP